MCINTYDNVWFRVFRLLFVGCGCILCLSVLSIYTLSERTMMYCMYGFAQGIIQLGAFSLWHMAEIGVPQKIILQGVIINLWGCNQNHTSVWQAGNVGFSLHTMYDMDV